jgi:ABC-type multidrug transport system ATPase subunit
MQAFLDALRQLQAGQRLIVGSGGAANLVLPAPGVDVQHACFTRRGGLLFVQDLDSQNGTFINRNEVRGLELIQPGDLVRLGDFECVLTAATSPIAASLPATPPAPRGLTSVVSQAVSASLPQSSPADLALSVVAAVKTIRGGRRILDRVSFHLEAGQFLGILGASGSGKSTLIKSLAGIVELTEGAVVVQGQPASSALLRMDRRIAYLPQDVVIHEALTAGMALDYIARLKAIGENEEQRSQIVLAVLDRVGLIDRVDVPIHRLSGGQQKRVALAAELLGDPKLILLDEATSGLDPATEEEMMGLFRSLAREGRTVICITHSPGRLHMCDRLLFLNSGKCIFYGTPDELRQFFNVKTIEEVYAKQEDHRADEWESL